MALTNFTLPFGGLTTQNWAATISPLQPHHANAVNNLLYGPAGHQESDEPPAGTHPNNYYKNDPYAPPQQQQQQSQFRSRPSKSYLPPPPSPSQNLPSSLSSSSSQIGSNNENSNVEQQQQQQNHQEHQYNQPSSSYLPPLSQPSPETAYGEEGYGIGPTRTSVPQYFNGYNTQTRTYQPEDKRQPLGDLHLNQNQNVRNEEQSQGYPERPPGFTRVQAGKGSRTQVHAVLDYDAEEGEEPDYYDEGDKRDGKLLPTVTPIQGPIFLKNGTVPVVPLFSYPTLNNGTFVQIPIWWTALSVALGLDIRGDIIRGVPCVKRYHQLFCPTAGNSYPIDKIERFIDDNKALMRRMYGDFEMTDSDYGPTQSSNRKRRRSMDEPDLFDLSGIPKSQKAGDDLELVPDSGIGETYFGKLRKKRQNTNFRGGSGNQQGNKRNQASTPPPLPRQGAGSVPNGGNESSTGRVDSCESKIEIVTPYWASNSAGKIRAIVNTQHFEQAIHQEICTKVQTSRCGNDCGCEQKYKWHRLLAYDPDNDCKGIFMDWFLFPSCCVCRCSP